MGFEWYYFVCVCSVYVLLVSCVYVMRVYVVVCVHKYCLSGISRVYIPTLFMFIKL